jgi:hypothetical protein
MIPIINKERDMGAGPVEDSIIGKKTAEAPVVPGTLRIPGDVPPAPESSWGTPPNVARAQAGLPPMPASAKEEYIKEAHLFIEAQQTFIHQPDVRAFASAQEAWIKAQMAYITNLQNTISK